MKTKYLSGILLFTIGGATWLWADQVWEEKSYRSWTLEEAQQILRDSPWAQTVGEAPAPGAAEESGAPGATAESGEAVKQESLLLDVPTFGTVSGAGSGRNWSGVVQWASSFTLRQATARAGQLQGTISSTDAAQLLMMLPQEYIIAVRGDLVPLVVAGLPEQTREAVQQSVYLQPRSEGEKIRPGGIEINLVGEAFAVFYFARGPAEAPVLSLQQGTVKFNWSSGLDTVSVIFDLTKMTRGGKPDL